jgi:hypothetical protein
MGPAGQSSNHRYNAGFIDDGAVPLNLSAAYEVETKIF